MPILQVQVAADRSPALSRRIHDTLVDLTTRVLGKRPELTAVVLHYVDPEDWFVGGRTLAELGRRSYWFDVKVVDETNTKAEKARFLAEAHAALSGLLGEVHEESYIHVADVRATAYGFGGRTQEWRHQHPDDAPAAR